MECNIHKKVTKSFTFAMFLSPGRLQSLELIWSCCIKIKLAHTLSPRIEKIIFCSTTHLGNFPEDCYCVLNQSSHVFKKKLTERFNIISSLIDPNKIYSWLRGSVFRSMLCKVLYVCTIKNKHFSSRYTKMITKFIWYSKTYFFYLIV